MVSLADRVWGALRALRPPAHRSAHRSAHGSAHASAHASVAAPWSAGTSPTSLPAPSPAPSPGLVPAPLPVPSPVPSAGPVLAPLFAASATPRTSVLTPVELPGAADTPRVVGGAEVPARDAPGIRSRALSAEARHAFGGVLPLLDLPRLRDILVQVRGDEAELWIDTGHRLRRISGWRASAAAVRGLAIQLIAAGGRHLDDLTPVADVRLGDGIRVHAVLAPIAVDGAAVSIRVPRAQPLSFTELYRDGLCGAAEAEALAGAVRDRRNLLLTGATGSGKTTVLAALLDLVPARERIVTIEDVAELRLRHPHRVALEARQPNAEGVGEISLDRLLREALRMRPDRLVLGECRGAEVATLLSALNSGHNGGAGTLHASGLGEAPARLEALGALAGLDPPTLARQVVSAIDLLVHLERAPSGSPRVVGCGVLVLDGTALGIRKIPLAEAGSHLGAVACAS